MVCPDAAQAELVLGQMKATVRRNYSNPPLHAGLLVASILNTPELHAQWAAELDGMRARIQLMRTQLHAVLSAKLPGRDFGYFLTQRGMFSYTGLSAAQVDRLREEFGVYLVRSGRMCVAGLNSGRRSTSSARAAVSARPRRWQRCWVESGPVAPAPAGLTEVMVSGTGAQGAAQGDDADAGKVLGRWCIAPRPSAHRSPLSRG